MLLGDNRGGESHTVTGQVPVWAFWMSIGLPCMHVCIQLTRGTRILDSAEVNKFCTVAFHIFGFPVWNLLYVTLLASRILK
jgi:hypothetical protein